jgi:hypothetical protein
MRFARKDRRGVAAALAVAIAALAAGCAGGTAASGVYPAHPAVAISGAGTRAAGPVPPVFAVSFEPARPGRGLGDRLALLSSRTGLRLRWLTPQPDRATDQVLGVRAGWVYFVRSPLDIGVRPSGSPGPAIWRVRVTGGRTQLVQAGASDYAVSPDGRAVAYVTSADHGNVVEVVARNLATGRRNTITMAARPDRAANNWPPEISGLTWAPDDVHLAVQFELTAAISSVLTFGAFSATAIGDARTPPAPCPAASRDQCEESDPAYLASGALTYLVQRRSGSGATRVSLVAWQAGRTATLLSFPAGPPGQSYDMTGQGQAIWASGPAQPAAPQTIWRWSGGTPAKIISLPPLGASPDYLVGAIAW